MGTGETTVQQSFLSDWLISMSPNRQGTHQARIATHMYVRRVTARFVRREDKSAAMYSAFLWRRVLLARMSSAACLSLQVGRSLKTIIGIRLQTRGVTVLSSLLFLCRLRGRLIAAKVWSALDPRGLISPPAQSPPRVRHARLYVLQRGISNRPLDDRSVHDQVSRSGLWRRVFGQQPNAHLV